MNTRKPYPTDLTDSQWANVEPYFPSAPKTGRPRTIDVRELCNAYWYVLRAGCAWRLLPHDFPAWKTVYSQVRRWKECGVWERIHDRLRDDLRLAEGRPLEPSAGVLDSQSVKAADYHGPRGYDAGKKNRRPETPHSRGFYGLDPVAGGDDGERAGPGRSQVILYAAQNDTFHLRTQVV